MIQMFESRDINQNKSDIVSLNQKSNVASPKSNNTFQQNDVKQHNTVSLTIQEASAEDANDKEKTFCDQEVQGEALSLIHI